MEVETLLIILGVIFTIYQSVMYYLRLKMIDTKGKPVLITGCDHGFGNILAKSLDQMGVTVLACCLTEQGATSLRESSSSKLETYLLDVSNDQSIKELAAKIKQKHPTLWGLVNNAGIVDGGTVESIPMESFRNVINVNLLGLIAVTKAFLPLIRKNQGRIVNIASVAGRIGAPQMSSYSASKYGVEGFTDCLRHEMNLFGGVKVILIEPGFFNTPLVDSTKLQAVWDRHWKATDPAIQADYGEEFWTTSYKKVSQFITLFASRTTERVPKSIIHALFAEYPRIRYVVGYDANWIWIPASKLPDVVIEYGLKIMRFPKPASAIAAAAAAAVATAVKPSDSKKE